MTGGNNIRVRFAPSPTGYLHIGSARTALFNWLLARSGGGTFILRIEDTDRKRSDEKYLNEILESLKWLGLEWDEKLYRQSKREKIYKDYAAKLLKSGKAYEAKGGAMIFSMPKEKITVKDLVHGPIEFDNTLQEDLVIMKSDGTPAYNFACVVDDIEMNITHVVRGDDHISNTPKQAELYKALGARPPDFAHIPLILGEDRSRLSKRHGATSIAEYRAEGYIPDGMVNYLALLGWSPGGNREILPREEIVKLFSLSRIGKTGAVFDRNKLDWINSQHLRTIDTPTLFALIKPYLEKAGFLKKKPEKETLKKIIRLFKTRIKTLSDFCAQAEYFFVTNVKYNNDAVKKYLKRKELKAIFNFLIKDLESVSPFNTREVEISCRSLIQRLGISGADLIHPVRVAITGRSVSPGIFDVMSLLGKDTVIKRLRLALKKYCK